jgi:hypothetical protein
VKRNVCRAVAVLALSIGISLGGAAVATAAPGDPPQSGDPRATAVAGNVTTCAAAGLPGTKIQVTSNITGNTFIDITAVPAGYVITGVVVKGGPAYNKYPNLGALPWNDLHAPLVPSGKPAEISHWFVCGKKKTTTTTTTTKTTTTTTKTTATTTKTTTKTTTSTSTTSTSTGSSSSSSSSSSGATTTSSKAAVVPASNNSGLAQTGFSGGPLVLIGGLLLVGGAAALLLARSRRRS